MTQPNWEADTQREESTPPEITQPLGQLSVHESIHRHPDDLSAIRSNKDELTREEYYSQLAYFFRGQRFSQFFDKLPEGTAKDVILASLLTDIGPWRSTQSDTILFRRPVNFDPNSQFSTVGMQQRNAVQFRENDITVETKRATTGTLITLCDIERRLPAPPTNPEPLTTSEESPAIAFNAAELKVIKLLFKTNSAIAHELGIKPSTVRTHLYHINGKLKTADSFAVHQQLFQAGLIESEHIPTAPSKPLTAEENAVFNAAEGQNKAELAAQVGISLDKLSKCLAGIYEKYGIADRRQLAFVKIKQQTLATALAPSE